MPRDAKEYLSDYRAGQRKAKALYPEGPQAFGEMYQTIMKDGAIDHKTKELIGIGLAVALHCPHCIYLHVESCLKAGLAPGQVMEAANVAVTMAGGPAYTHLSLVAEALEGLRK
jgi:pyruvate dehydrogenase E2 component (dihydrolipoamide acetyltransferase)